MILLLSIAADQGADAWDVVLAVLQWVVSPLLVGGATWLVLRRTAVNAERGMQQTALTAEKVAESDRLERYAELQAERITRLEDELQTERRERIGDRELLQSLRAELRDERRVNHLAVDYILSIAEDIRKAPDCGITIRPAPYELRTRMDR